MRVPSVCLVLLLLSLGWCWSQKPGPDGVRKKERQRGITRARISGSALNSPDWPEDYATKLKNGDSFDYIVVGAGAAGAAAAGRLALDGLDVLLVEAGGDPNLQSRIPGAAAEIFDSSLDWAYRTVPNNMSCLSYVEKQCPFNRGKVLGGSTSTNYMMYIRGSPEDFNSWNWEGWTYEDLKPYFLAYEGFNDLDELPESSVPYHNTNGIMKIEFFQDSENSWKNTTIKGLKSLNFPFNPDINAESQIGVTQVAGYTFNGERESTATAYLVDNKVKQVLKVAKNTFCTGLIIDEQKVVRGIKVKINNHKKETFLYANNEVILSAGTISSPQILMLSGIGPADHLREMGIPVVADLPVGNNMSEHVLAITFVKVDSGYNSSVSVGFANEGEAAKRWAKSKDGALATIGLTDIAALFNIKCYDFENQQLVNDNSECDLANIQLAFIYTDAGTLKLRKKVIPNIYHLENEVLKPVSEANKNNPLIEMYPIVLQPKSKGYVRLMSQDPHDTPVIFPNFLENDEDVEQIVQAIQVLKHLTSSESFKKFGAELMTIRLSGCPEPDVDSYDYWRCYVRHLMQPGYHATGTVHGAVTPRLQVKGVSNLRVADLSVVPYVPRGNTAAISIAVGERLAAFIREELRKTGHNNEWHRKMMIIKMSK